jgi:hypothetical protein
VVEAQAGGHGFDSGIANSNQLLMGSFRCMCAGCRDISLRLHVPTTSLVPPAGGSAKGCTAGSEGDIGIGPLKPQSGG